MRVEKTPILEGFVSDSSRGGLGAERTYSWEFSKVARTAMIESVVVSRFVVPGRILRA